MINSVINDFDVMSSVGMKACPSDAVDSIKTLSDTVLQTAGGNGVIRELYDRIKGNL